MNLLEEIESLILIQFAKSKKLKGLIRGSVTPFQEALDHLEKLDEGRYIDKAEGYTLDVIGHIVDFTRDDMSDEDYKVWLKIAILLNNGSGTARDVYNILAVLYDDKPPVEITEHKYSAVSCDFLKLPSAPIITVKSIIRRALPLGVDCKFGNADPGSDNHEATVGLRSRNQSLPIFRFDTTGFGASVFAEFL